MRDEDAAQHAGQMLAALGIAAQPEKMFGGAAGQIAADPAMQLHRQIARTAQGEIVDRLGGKNPGIFAAAAVLHGDDGRVGGWGNAGQVLPA